MLRKRIFTILIALNLFSSQYGYALSDITEVSRVQNGNSCYSLAVSGNYVFNCEGQDVIIYNIADRSNPFKIGELSHTSELNGKKYQAQLVAVRNNYLFVGYSQQMRIYDVSDINNISVIGGYTYGAENIEAIFLDDEYLYISVSKGGLRILDAQDSSISRMELEEVYAPDETVNDVMEFSIIYVDDNYLYGALKDKGKFVILNIDDKAAPSLAGYYNLKIIGNEFYGLLISDIAVYGSSVYVSTRDQAVTSGDNTSWKSNGIYIFNITDLNGGRLMQPQLMRPFENTPTGRITGLEIDDEILYVNVQDYGRILAYSLPLTAGSQPIVTKTIQNGSVNGAIITQISDGYLYVSDKENGWIIMEKVE